MYTIGVIGSAKTPEEINKIYDILRNMIGSYPHETVLLRCMSDKAAPYVKAYAGNSTIKCEQYALASQFMNNLDVLIILPKTAQGAIWINRAKEMWISVYDVEEQESIKTLEEANATTLLMQTFAVFKQAIKDNPANLEEMLHLYNDSLVANGLLDIIKS